MNIKDEIKNKDQTIKELEEEDKRLNQVIINLHEELAQQTEQNQKQKRIIKTQKMIIDYYIELTNIMEE